MKRPSEDLYFIAIASVVAVRATCARREVGCVIVDELGHISATGYNGVASGLPHCIDKPCSGAKCKSGTGLDKCEAIHAEANALLQCRDVYAIKTIYCTAKPCTHCIKLIMGTSCKRVVYLEDYPSTKTNKLAKSANIELIRIKSSALDAL